MNAIKACIQIPAKTYFQNILVNPSGEFYAVYKMKGNIYNFIGEGAKISRHGDLNIFMQNLAQQTNRVKLIGKPYFSSLRQINERNKKTFKGDLAEEAKTYTDDMTEHLIEVNGDDSADMETFLIAKLRKPSQRKKKWNQKLANYLYEGSSFLGIDNSEIPANLVDGYLDVEAEFFAKTKSKLRRATIVDMEYLHKQPNFRGIGEPKLSSIIDGEWEPGHDTVIKKGETVIIPDKRDIVSLWRGHAKFEPLDSIYKIKQLDGKVSYQTNFAVSKIQTMWFPGNEWLYYLKMIGFPVEWVIDIDFQDNREFVKEVARQKGLVEDQYGHTQKTNDIPAELEDSYEKGRTQEAEAQRSKEAYTFTNFVLNVSAASEDQLRDRMIALNDFFDKFDVEIENPISDQAKMFMEFYPGTKKEQSAYAKRLSTGYICATMFEATTQIGDQTGLPLGVTGRNKKPVHIDLRKASLEDKSPSIVASGSLGGGKTTLGYLFALFNVLCGGLSLIINPKGDTRDWSKFLPFLKGHIDIIDISGAEEHLGKLDPIMMQDIKNKKGEAREEAKREALEQSISTIAYMMNASTESDIMLAINECCKYAKDHEDPCMERVLEYANGIYQLNERASKFSVQFEKLASHLEVLKDSKITSLIFGNGKNDVIKLNKKLTILNIHGLNLAPNNLERKSYNTEQVASAAVINALAGLAKKFAFMTKLVFKFLLLDEKWFWEKTPIGKMLMDEILKQGRSLNTGMYVIDQNASSMPEDMRNLIGIRCVLKANSKGEAESSCKLLNIETSPENIDLIMNIPKHHVMIQDLEGRVELVHVLIIHEDILKAFDTNPMADILAQEERERNEGESA